MVGLGPFAKMGFLDLDKIADLNPVAGIGARP